MTKRVLFILFAVILIVSSCGNWDNSRRKTEEKATSQKNKTIITKDDYNKLVDYVNAFYVKAFIDKKISEKNTEIGKDYIDDYQSEKKSNLSVNSYNEASDYKTIENTIGNYPKAKQLAEIINKKKNTFNEGWTKEQIIKELLELPKDKPTTKNDGFSGYLKNETDKLKEDLKEQIPDNCSPPKEENSKSTSKEDEEESNRETNNESIGFSWGKILFLITIIVLGFFSYKKRKRIKNLFNRFILNSAKAEEKETEEFDYKKKIKQLERDIMRLKPFEQDNAQLYTENKELKQRNQKLEQRNQKLEQRNQELEQRNQELEQKIKDLKRQIQSRQTGSSIKKEIVSTQYPDHLYADAIINGVFNRVSEHPNEDTIYELLLKSQNDKSITFTIYSNAYRRVMNTPDFVDGCDKQKINPQPQTLKVEEGTAVQNENGKWKVTKPAKIKFI